MFILTTLSPQSGTPYGESYGDDDTVGCGWDLRSGVVFFTRNGNGGYHVVTCLHEVWWRREERFTGARTNENIRLYSYKLCFVTCSCYAQDVQSNIALTTGKHLGTAFKNIKGAFFPFVSLGSSGATVLANFGQVSAAVYAVDVYRQ